MRDMEQSAVTWRDVYCTTKPFDEDIPHLWSKEITSYFTEIPVLCLAFLRFFLFINHIHYCGEAYQIIPHYGLILTWFLFPPLILMCVCSPARTGIRQAYGNIIWMGDMRALFRPLSLHAHINKAIIASRVSLLFSTALLLRVFGVSFSLLLLIHPSISLSLVYSISPSLGVLAIQRSLSMARSKSYHSISPALALSL